MKTLLLLTILMAACGEQPPTEQTPEETKEQAQMRAALEASAKVGRQDDTSQSSGSIKDGMLKGAFLVSKKEQVDCLSDKEGQLIYVKDEAQFYFCEKEEWVLIELKGTNGKDGKSGENGKNGSDGTNGKDGRNGLAGNDGENGENGENGEDGENGVNGKDAKRIPDTNQWVNPVDGSLWFLGIYASEANIFGKNLKICPSKARAVTANEIQEAYRSGLLAKLSEYFLTNTDGSSYGFYFNNKDKDGVVEIMTLLTSLDRIQSYPLGAISNRKYYAVCVID